MSAMVCPTVLVEQVNEGMRRSAAGGAVVDLDDGEPRCDAHATASNDPQMPGTTPRLVLRRPPLRCRGETGASS